MKTEYDHIYQTSRGRYQVKVSGMYRYAATLDEAVKLRDAMIGVVGYDKQYAKNVLAVAHRDVQKTLVEDLIKEWYENTKRPSCEQNTRKRYDDAVYKAIIPMLGYLKPAEVTTATVQQYVIALHTHGYPEGVRKSIANSSIAVTLTVLRQFFEFLATNMGLNMRNPCSGVKMPTESNRKKKRKRALSYDECDKVMEWIREHYKIEKYWMYRLYLESGLRRGELLGMKWDHVDLKAGTIDVSNVITRNVDTHKLELKTYPKNENSIRTVPISYAVRRYLNLKHRHAKKESEYVWLNKVGNVFSPKKVTQDFKAALRACGINDESVSLHSTRHTFASTMADRGLDLQTTMAVGGWGKATTLLNVYTESMKTKKQRVKKAAEHIGL